MNLQSAQISNCFLKVALLIRVCIFLLVVFQFLMCVFRFDNSILQNILYLFTSKQTGSFHLSINFDDLKPY